MDKQKFEEILDPKSIHDTSEQVKSSEVSVRQEALRKLSLIALKASETEIDSEIFAKEFFNKTPETESTLPSPETESLEYLQKITKSGTWSWDSETGARTFDKQYALIAGYSLEDIDNFKANTWNYLTHPGDELISNKQLQRVIDGGTDEYSNEIRIRCKDGSFIWVNEYGQIEERDADGKALRIIGAIVNITERKILELKVDTLIDIDKQTGLNNYYYYREQFERLDNSRRKTAVSIVDIEIDNLTKINNMYGKATGDQLLIDLAEILNNEFRLTDCVARISGGEFRILLPEMDEDVANSKVDRIRKDVEEYNVKFLDMPISISIGAATAGVDESLIVAEDLADDRMYADKLSKEK